jgi:hypothetical protein
MAGYTYTIPVRVALLGDGAGQLAQAVAAAIRR